MRYHHHLKGLVPKQGYGARVWDVNFLYVAVLFQRTPPSCANGLPKIKNKNLSKTQTPRVFERFFAKLSVNAYNVYGGRFYELSSHVGPGHTFPN